MGIGCPFLLVVGERADDIAISRTTLVVDQRHPAAQLIEGEAGLHPEAVGAVGTRDFRPKSIGLVVDGLGDFAAAIQKPEGHQRGFVPGVPEAGFAARDDVELVVGELQSSVDAHGDGDGAFFGFLKVGISSV